MSTPDAGLHYAPPSARYVPVRSWHLDHLTDLRDVRAGVVDEVAARDGAAASLPPGKASRDVALVLSELATNALEHAGAPVLVELLEHRRGFLIAVTDHHPDAEPHIAGYRPPGQGGFGLRIVRELAHDLAWFRTDHAKTVWAEISS
jgi:anti-sigma regulatory factor (Ser/Thr protein kinase)